MRQFLNSTLLCLFIPIIFIQCNNIDCPGGGLDFHFSGDLIIEGTEKVSKNIRVQYPRDCSNNPRDGYYELRILNENEIPGLSLSLTEFSVTDSWFGHQTPASGEVDVQLWAWPEEGGTLNAPEPGTYQIRIEAAFESEASVEKVLTVQVLSDGFSVVIIEPNADSEYSEQTTIIKINALARDQTHGITSLDYRLNQDPWVVNSYTDVLQVELEEWMDVPVFGEHILQFRAINGQGDELIAEQDFFVPEDPTRLSDHNWDGGGDNLNWGDPLNWEDDRLPGPKDRARILNSQTAQVRIGHDQAAERVFSVGAVRIDPEIVLAGNTVLQLEAPENKSEVSNTRFEVLNGNQRPKIRFGPDCRECRLEFRSTLQMAEMTLQAYQPAEVISNRGSIPEGSFNGFAQAFLDGPVTLRLAGSTHFEEPVFWEFGLMPEGSEGPTIRLSSPSSWTMTNGSTFKTVDNAPSSLQLEGAVEVNNIAEDYRPALVIDGNIHVQGSNRLLIRNFFPSPQGNSLVILNSTYPEENSIKFFSAPGQIYVNGGRWNFENPLSLRACMKVNNGAEVYMSNGDLELDSLVIRDNSLVNMGSNYLGNNIWVESGRIEFDENCSMGTFTLDEGSFVVGSQRDTNTVQVNQFRWNGGEDRSPRGARGTIEVVTGSELELFPTTQRGLMVLDPGTGLNFTWNTHIKVSRYSTLRWLSGDLYSNGNPILFLNIDPEETLFEIQADRRRLWGFNTLAGGEAFSFLKIQNANRITFSGSEEVNIAGCLTLIGEGSLEENRNGQLNMVASDGFCE